MKRVGGLYEKIASLKNLQEADRQARKGKSHQPGVRRHRKAEADNLAGLRASLLDESYVTSPYTVFTIFEPKERQIHRLPYYPDRITHHAIMAVLEPVFLSFFTADTYSCVKGRGIHGAAYALKKALRDQAGTQYCLKLDIRKFYPTISHPILKNLLRRKFKDDRLMGLLEEIIDSADGLPIGNYLSQYLANFYLTYLDRWVKQEKRVKHYFRYADDLVILAPDKPSLHALLSEIRLFLRVKLKLEIKNNYQVFPVAARGIDFVGYRFYHTHILLRKRIKTNMLRSLAKRPSVATLASYYGWLAHCNGNHLLKKLLHEKFQRFGSDDHFPRLRGRQVKNRPPIE